MVDFSKQIETDITPNFTARSQGYTSSAIGNLFANMGTSLGLVSDAMETTAKETIDSEILNFADDLVVDATSGGKVPEGLESGLTKTERGLKASKKYSGTKGQTFYADAVKRIRDLRAKYPGYGEYIDKKVHSAIGLNPRQMAITQEIASQNAFQESMSSLYNSEEAAALGLNKVPWQQKTEEELAEDMAIYNDFRSRMAQAKYKMVNGKPDGYQMMSNGITATIMTNIMKDPAIQPFVSGQLKYSDMNAQQKEAAFNTFTQIELAAKDALTKLEISAETQLISAEEKKKYREQVLRSIEDVRELFFAGDINAAMFASKMIQYGTDDEQRRVYKEYPVLQTIKALEAIDPALAVDYKNMWATKNAKEGEVAQFGAIMAGRIMAGQQNLGTVSGVVKSMDSVTVDEKNKVFRDAVVGSQSMVLNSKNPEVISNFVKSEYSVDNLRTLLANNEGGDMKLLDFMFRPSLTDHIEKYSKNDFTLYANTAVLSFLNTDEYRNLKSTMQQSGLTITVDDTGKVGIRIPPREQIKDRGVLGFLADLPPYAVGPVNIFDVIEGVLYYKGSFATRGDAQQLSRNVKNLSYILEKNGSNLAELFEQEGFAVERTKAQEKTIDVAPTGEFTVSPEDESMQRAREKLLEEQTSFRLQDGTQITPTSGTTTMAEFTGASEIVSSLYSDARNLDVAAKTLVGEARGETSEGRQAIGEVLRNRALASGRSIAEEAQLKKGDSKFGQFSTWNEGDPNLAFIQDLDETSPLYVQASQDFLSSANSDITKGATHYYNPSIADPDWAKDGNFVETARIGKHVFGYLKKGDPYKKGLSKYRGSEN